MSNGTAGRSATRHHRVAALVVACITIVLANATSGYAQSPPSPVDEGSSVDWQEAKTRIEVYPTATRRWSRTLARGC